MQFKTQVDVLINSPSNSVHPEWERNYMKNQLMRFLANRLATPFHGRLSDTFPIRWAAMSGRYEMDEDEETYLFHVISEENVFQIGGDGILGHVEIDLGKKWQRYLHRLQCQSLSSHFSLNSMKTNVLTNIELVRTISVSFLRMLNLMTWPSLFL